MIDTRHERPLWKWILLFVGSTFLAMFGYGLLQGIFLLTDEAGLPFLLIFPSIIYLGLYALFVRWFEKRWPTDLPLRRLIPHTLLGLLVGFAFMVMTVSTITAMGYADEYWNDFSWPEQFWALMLFLMVAVGEEVMSRGVIFRLIDERWGTWVALIVSALIFGFGHISNDNSSWWASLAIAIEAGLLLGAAYKWSGNLWVPIGIHWAWNYTQGNIFGLAVSGNEMESHALTTIVDGPDIITGGAFGPEASIITVILGIVVTLVLLSNCRR